MDQKDWKKLSHIFDKVLTLPPQGQTAYIKNMCGDNPDLEIKVRKMLDQLEKSDQYFEEQFEKNQAVIDELDSILDNAEESEDFYEGKTIGRWVITELIGRGGMGSVYKAQRTDESGLRQVGALKIVHQNLITKSHIERFKLEQQILSGLQHPNISGFIDSGITDEGIPYMVMEYVEGESILRYCDRKKLTIDQRLEIFKTICRTIQYAHKSLIVHRDLKPENILITEDGRIKILDFGIAKLLDPNLYGGSAIETQPGMRMLSLEYASPEQISGKPVNTSTDIYSLGILLYKLLTGLHPFEVVDHSWREVEQMVLEQDPPLPGTRLANFSNKEKCEQIAGERKTEPLVLIKKLKGDLDAIINKALRKNHDRRFDSVESLLIDINRHQTGLTIYARPDSTGYRVRKFIQRHKSGVAATTIVMLILTILVTFYTIRLTSERNRAEQSAREAEQISDFLAQIFEGADPNRANDGSMTARELLDQGFERIQTELEDEPGLQAQILSMIGNIYNNLGLYDDAYLAIEKSVDLFHRIGDESPRLAEALLRQANLEYRLNNFESAAKYAREALDLNIKHYGDGHAEVASVMNTLAMSLEETGEKDEAYEMYYRIVDIRRSQPDQGANLAANLNNLAILLQEDGQLDEADELFEEAVTIVEEKWGEEHPYMAYTLSGYSGVHQDRGEYDLAESNLQRALEIGRTVLPDEHPFIAVVLHNLGGVFENREQYEDAVNHYREGLTLRHNSLPPDHPDIAISLEAIGMVLIKLENYEEAEPALREALDIRNSVYEEGDWRIAQVESYLGRSLLQQKKFEEAGVLLNKSHPVLEKSLGAENIHTLRALEDLNELNGKN